MTIILLPLAFVNPSGLPVIDLIVIFTFGLVYAIVYFIYLERKKKRIKNESNHSKNKIATNVSIRITQPKINSIKQPSKFTRHLIVGLIVAALVSIGFGAQYYWTRVPTTTFDFLAGFVFVISGVAVIGFTLFQWTLSRIES